MGISSWEGDKKDSIVEKVCQENILCSWKLSTLLFLFLDLKLLILGTSKEMTHILYTS